MNHQQPDRSPRRRVLTAATVLTVLGLTAPFAAATAPVNTGAKHRGPRTVVRSNDGGPTETMESRSLASSVSGVGG